MTDPKPQFDLPFLNPFRRYVPLAAWGIVLFTLLAIPLKIIGYGYLPGDDALRHAAKAVSGKPWQDILVLGGSFQMDHNLGWHLLLGQIHHWTNWGTEPLVIFSVVALFTLLCWSVLPWLKRPEAWLVALMMAMIVSDLPRRFLIGRPFLLTMTVLVTILLAWHRLGSAPPKWWTALWMAGLISLCSFVHGVWYLWALPVAAFFSPANFAGAWRCRRAGFWERCWAACSAAIRSNSSCRRLIWRFGRSANT